MNTKNIKIEGTGKYLPKTVVTAEELGKKIGVSTDWILKKSGVERRHFVQDETTAQMGAYAALDALQAAKLQGEDIDLIVSAGGVMQQMIPCTAALIKKELGWDHLNIPVFDINSTCLGFITALDTVSSLVQTGRYRKVLIVCSEIASVGINWEDHDSCTLFGDGAAAVVVGQARKEDASCILSSHVENYCEGVDLCRIQGGGAALHPREYRFPLDNRFLFEMDGMRIFKMASRYIIAFMEKLMGWMKLKDFDLFIPHQASLMALRIIQKKLGIEEGKMMMIAKECGNIISASIPMALHEAIQKKRIVRGNKIILMGTSAGFSIGGLTLVY